MLRLCNYKTHNVDLRDCWLLVKHFCEDSKVTATLNFSVFFLKDTFSTICKLMMINYETRVLGKKSFVIL